MVFRDEAGKTVSDPVVVDIEVNSDKTEIKISDFKVDDKEPITNPESVKVSLTVECESGIYFGTPRFAVFPGNGGYEVYSKSSESVYLSPGESKDVIIDADMSSLKDGHYMAVIYNGGEIMTDRVYFHIERETVGIESIETDSKDATIYDLNGIRHNNSSQQGIFIIDGKKVLKTQ